MQVKDSILNVLGLTDKTRTENERVYRRNLIADARIARFFFESGRVFPIGDLSYGGFSVVRDDNCEPFEKIKNGRQVLVKIDVLGEEIVCAAKKTFDMRNKMGFEFQHTESKLLLFMRSVLDFIEIGAELAERSPKGINPNQLAGGTSPRGYVASPTVYVNHDFEKNKLIEAGIGFNEIKATYALVYRAGQVMTYHNIAPGALLGEPRPTPGIDVTILRKGILILKGVQSASVENHRAQAALEFFVHFFLSGKAAGSLPTVQDDGQSNVA